jgi:hypothetical protein
MTSEWPPMDGDVGAEGERVLEEGRGEGVVHDQPRAVASRDLGAGGDVDQAQQRIGGALDPHEPRGLADRLVDLLGSRRVDVREAKSEARHHLREQAVAAAVEVVGHHHVVAGLQQLYDAGDCGHTRRVGQTEAPLLQRREAALQRLARGVSASRVLEAAVHADGILGERDRLVHGDDRGPRGRVGILALMDRASLECRLAGTLVGHHQYRAVTSTSLVGAT